jgi:multidrug efflux pump subunit AcrA (membrane-fusion protein)
MVDQADGTLRLSRVEVSLGQVSEQSAEVLKGLTRGDRIVAAGTHLLADGESVRIFNP